MAGKSRKTSARGVPGRPYLANTGPEPQQHGIDGVHARGDAFGAPHFPPSENLPPQARRLAEHKRRSAAAKGKLPRKDYPDALPTLDDFRAAFGELREQLEETAGPVLRSAGASFHDLTRAIRELIHVPGELLRAFIPERRTS